MGVYDENIDAGLSLVKVAGAAINVLVKGPPGTDSAVRGTERARRVTQPVERAIHGRFRFR